MEQLRVSTNPHVRHADTTQGIMLDVILALAPAFAGGVWLFGFRVLLVAAVCIGVAVLCEFGWCKLMKKPCTVGDLSAVVTGLLLTMNLPVSVPLWVAGIGSIVAIIVVKEFFGGLGQNFANPAITARIVLLVSFPAYLTSWASPLAWQNGVAAVSSATPLVGKNIPLMDLFLGKTAGCIGETSALLLLLGGLYLIVRRVISPVLPAAFLATLGLMMWAFGENPLAAILSGGAMLGAVFMATDYATSPSTNLGKLIFGIGCGVITALIRRFGSMPEGVSYSILLMNLLTPHINKLTAPKPFGWEVRSRE